MRVCLICWVLIGGLLAGCASDFGTGTLAGSGASGAAADEGLVRLAADVEARGKIDAALPLYERATLVSDDTTTAQLRLGDAYMRAAKADQAIKAYRTALAQSPENGDALLGLGSALVRTGDVDGAITALAKAAPLVNTMSAYNRLGVAQTLAGSLPAAQASFEAARALAPDDLDVRTNLALAAALDGKADKAIALMREVVALPAAEARHRRGLVIVFGLLGRAAEGRVAAPRELPASEVKSLLVRANSIRALTDAKARARALGTIIG
jgi:Flp pilus assembly protein TadD